MTKKQVTQVDKKSNVVKPAVLGEVKQTDATYVSLPVSMEMADRQWQDKYGYVLAPLLYRNRYDRLDARSGYHLWLEQKDNALIERKLLRDTQVFLPHEEITFQLNTVFESELKDSGLRIIRDIPSHHGDTMHWEIRSDTLKRTIRNSYIGKDTPDEIFFGAIVRNGIGTGVALGVDLFTYRQICTNGAIARGTDLGSFSISHVRRKDQKIQDALVPAIKECIGSLKALTDYYQKATFIKFNQKILDQIIKVVQPTDVMLPDYVEVDVDLRDRKRRHPKHADLQKLNEYKLLKQGTTYDMWKVFNDFTNNYWHNKNMGFNGIAYRENRLHKVLMKVVDNAAAAA